MKQNSLPDIAQKLLKERLISEFNQEELVIDEDLDNIAGKLLNNEPIDDDCFTDSSMDSIDYGNFDECEN